MTKINMEIGGEKFDVEVKNESLLHALTKHILVKKKLYHAILNMGHAGVIFDTSHATYRQVASVNELRGCP